MIQQKTANRFKNRFKPPIALSLLFLACSATLLYETNHFTAKIEQVFVAEQDALSRSNTLDPLNPNNSFLKTDGYALTNVFLTWLVNDGLTVTAGAENLFDEDYSDHLTGFNRVIGSEVTLGNHMPGRGVNFFGQLRYKW